MFNYAMTQQNTPTTIEITHNHLFKWLIPGLITIAVTLVLLDAFITELEWTSNGSCAQALQHHL